MLLSSGLHADLDSLNTPIIGIFKANTLFSSNSVPAFLLPLTFHVLLGVRVPYDSLQGSHHIQKLTEIGS